MSSTEESNTYGILHWRTQNLRYPLLKNPVPMVSSTEEFSSYGILRWRVKYLRYPPLTNPVLTVSSTEESGLVIEDLTSPDHHLVIDTAQEITANINKHI